MAVPTVSLTALIAAAREENRQAARKIAACYRVHCEWITLDAQHKHYSRYGRTEMAVALGCSATVAEAYISVGVALHTRLPLLRRAFETGEIDLPRIRTVCRILDNLSDDIVTSVENEIVEAARRSSPGPLEKEIWDILLRVAPEEAAALREFAKRFRHVSYSPAGELARIRAELTAPEAAAAWQLLEEMADTLCPKDPRGKQERLCDAFMARMHGEPRLVCRCQREDCPKADAVLPDRRVPLTMVTVDIATLLGLLANPAYLAGHGSIDPDLARELARNSQWQILLTDAVTLAEKLGLAHQNPDTAEWERRTDDENSGTATGSETDTDTDTNVGSAADSDETGSAANSGAEAASSTEQTSTSSPAPAHVPGNTSAPAPVAPVAPTDDVDQTEEGSRSEDNDKTEQDGRSEENGKTEGNDKTEQDGRSEENGETASAAASAPSATPRPQRPDPVRRHAATRATAPLTDPPSDPILRADPEAAAAPVPASAPRASEHWTGPAPDPAPKYGEHRSPATTSDTPAAEGPAPGAGSPAAASNDRQRRRLESLASAAARFCTHTPVGKGTQHSSALDLAAHNRSASTSVGASTVRSPADIYLGNASLAAALEAAIAADPTLGKSVRRDPLTDRALIYRPDALTTAAVRLRDRHCRFPDCHRPAAHCELDHIVPFDHANPCSGGWTTINNLHCLCEYHHTVKTAGYWKAVMLPGGAILWTSTSKTARITLPANGTAVPVIGNDLRPHIPTKPRRSGIIAYPDPPNPPHTDEAKTERLKAEEPEAATETAADDTEEPPF